MSFVGPDGKPQTLAYDRLVLAAGSTGFRPNIPGLAKHTFGVEQIDEAIKLDQHLHVLAKRPASKARNTVVVAGGGFTGIETATEMPERLRAIFGHDADIRVVIVERNEVIAPQTGDNPRPVIAKAIHDAGVETILGVGVTAVDESGVTLSTGERIESATVIWTAGMRASPLTAQIPAPRDNLGRLVVDTDLRVPGVGTVFATGDTAKIAADELGNVAPMTCQFAIRLGAFAGHNAAADLLGLPTEAYHQKTLRGVPRPRRFRCDLRAGMESATGADRVGSEGDQAGDQHRLDLPAGSRPGQGIRLRASAGDGSLSARTGRRCIEHGARTTTHEQQHNQRNTDNEHDHEKY